MGANTHGENSSEPDTKNADEKRDATVSPFDLTKVDPEKIKMIEELGVPVGQIINWAMSVEERLLEIQKEMPAEVEKAMMNAIKRAREEQFKRGMKAGGMPQGGGIGLGDVIRLLGGGGSGSDEVSKILMELGMENLLMGREITREFIKRSMPGVLEKVDTDMQKRRKKESEA